MNPHVLSCFLVLANIGIVSLGGFLVGIGVFDSLLCSTPSMLLVCFSKKKKEAEMALECKVVEWLGTYGPLFL